MSRVFCSVVILALPLLLAACQPKVPVSPPPTRSAAQHLTAGKKALAAGDCKAALPELSEAVRLRPGLADAQLYLGICAYKEHQPARGEAALHRAMAANPASPRPYEALGIAEYTRDHRGAARKALQTALDKGSTNPQVPYYLGNVEMADGHCRAAFDAYRQAMHMDPSFQAAQIEFEAARRYCAKISARE